MTIDSMQLIKYILTHKNIIINNYQYLYTYICVCIYYIMYVNKYKYQLI